MLNQPMYSEHPATLITTVLQGNADCRIKVDLMVPPTGPVKVIIAFSTFATQTRNGRTLFESDLATHLFFIDDSGTKEYAANPSDYTLSAGNTRYFVFGGVLLRNDEAATLTENLRRLKKSVFGSDRVEMKSSWLRRPEEKHSRYLLPYGLKAEDLDSYIRSYYDLICDADLMLIAAVIDKVHMHETYGASPWYSPAVAYDLLVQRIQAELVGKGSAAVTIDDMTGATPKKTQHKLNLTRQHETFKKHGSKLRKGFAITTLDGRLRFMNSADSELIQVADIAAYNVYRQFVKHGSEWELAGLERLPTYSYFNRICRKFRNDGMGRIQGYGVVKFPIVKQVRWRVEANEKSEAAP